MQSLSDALCSAAAQLATASSRGGAELAATIGRALAAAEQATAAQHPIRQLEKVREAKKYHNQGFKTTGPSIHPILSKCSSEDLGLFTRSVGIHCT